MSVRLIVTFLELQVRLKSQIATVLLFADHSVLNRIFNGQTINASAS